MITGGWSLLFELSVVSGGICTLEVSDVHSWGWMSHDSSVDEVLECVVSV